MSFELLVLIWFLGLAGLAILLIVLLVKPARRGLAAWWLVAVPVAFIALWVTRDAVNEARAMHRRDACVLGFFDDDSDSVETLRVGWMPPRVQCRYHNSYLNETNVVWEERWFIYAPIVLLPAATALMIGATRYSWRRRRTRIVAIEPLTQPND